MAGHRLDDAAERRLEKASWQAAIHPRRDGEAAFRHRYSQSESCVGVIAPAERYAFALSRSGTFAAAQRGLIGKSTPPFSRDPVPAVIILCPARPGSYRHFVTRVCAPARLAFLTHRQCPRGARNGANARTESVVMNLMPSTYDVKGHLEKRRSIAEVTEVLPKRRRITEALDPIPSWKESDSPRENSLSHPSCASGDDKE